ncbi:tetratricopeptide repeat protein [Crocosphaera chwakensis]|uniref:AAA+ ATPase domain-containing protein n=1 Tax=Crocosphaera chwakensis CCY0110 TaxID=391612 RepID=A3IPH9_9CHRO|nr:NB-ARC domain-containing protein [Crocosphaera chwakensis]EAZ91744.1 hypothetical protein CY0110_26473 [Crocosphaera chwakensis CCY0110]
MDSVSDPETNLQRRKPVSIAGINAERFIDPIGRDDKIEELEKFLLSKRSNKRCKIVGIHGLPGVGKSLLAVHFVTKNLHQFHANVLFFRIDEYDYYSLVNNLCDYLNVDKNSPEVKRFDDLREQLKNQKNLLIFDNADRAKDIEKIKKLINELSYNCPIIITSRNLKLLKSFEGKKEDRKLIDLPILSEENALECLKYYTEEPATEQLNQLPNITKHIVKLLGNLPLALKIAGGTLTNLLQKKRNRNPNLQNNLENYLKQLEEAKEKYQLPKILSEEDENIDKSIWVSFMLTFDQLEDKKAKFFLCLSICPSEKFSLDEADSIGKAIELKHEDDVDNHIDALVDVSLIDEVQEQDEDNYIYEFHPLIHQFAAYKLRENPDLKKKAEEEYAQYFIDLVKNNRKDIMTHLESILYVAKLLKEKQIWEYNFAQTVLDDLKYGHSKSRKLICKFGVDIATEFYQLAIQLKKWEEAIDFGFAKEDFYRNLNNYQQAIDTLEEMQEILINIEPEEKRKLQEAKLLNKKGGLWQRKREYKRAMEDFNTSLKIGKEYNFATHIAMVLNSRGNCYKAQGELEEAKNDCEKSRIQGKMWYNQKDPKEKSKAEKHLGEVLTTLGGIYRSLGDKEKDQQQSQKYYGQSQIYLQESVSIRADRKNRNERDSLKDLAFSLDNYGQTLGKLRLYEDAEKAFHEGIKIEKQRENKGGEGLMLHNKGKMYMDKPDYKQAIHNFTSSLQKLNSIHDYRGMAMVHKSLAKAYKDMGKRESALYHSALYHCDQSIEINENKIKNNRKELNQLYRLKDDIRRMKQ